MGKFLHLLRTSPSWRVRLDVLGPLQVFYFHNLFLLSDELISELMDQLCELLKDPKVEVREEAAKTLSGIVRCSQRSAILSLRDRFMHTIRTTKIPKRRNEAGEEVPTYQENLLKARASSCADGVQTANSCALCRLGCPWCHVAHQRVPVRGAAVHPEHVDRDHVSPQLVATAHFGHGQSLPCRL